MVGPAAITANTRLKAYQLTKAGAPARTPVERSVYGKRGLSAEKVQEVGKAIQGQTSLKRFGTPEVIAKVAASDDSSYMIGSALAVDGGGTQLRFVDGHTHLSRRPKAM